jgi:hypothetical protein
MRIVSPKEFAKGRELAQKTFLWILTHPHEVDLKTLERAQNLASCQTIRQAQRILAQSS